MFAHFIHGALLRKELRQLTPLVSFILLMAFSVYVLFELFVRGGQGGPSSPGFILFALPALFSVGAGALSVSQEKETRTLRWLSSLPLPQERLILTKFAASVTCWAGLWVVAVLSCLFIDVFGLGPTFANLERQQHPIYSAWLVYWVFNSFYLLVAGHLTAWLLPSSMAGLIAFVPLAIAPPVLRFAIAYAIHPGLRLDAAQYDATLLASMVAVAAMLLPAAWLMSRFANAALSPQQSRVSANAYAAPAVAAGTIKRSSQTVLSPSSAMLWQAFRQNRTVYLSLLVATAVAGLPVLAFASGARHPISLDWEPWAVFTVFVSTAWMGVMVFQGDNLQDRIRFLAERGVSPAKAWAIRLLWPLAYISIVALCYAIVLDRSLSMNPDNPGFTLWVAVGGLLVAFAYSQWLAQLVRSPMLSAIGGPIVAAMGLAYLAFTYAELSPHLVYPVALVVGPLAATLLMMRRWMDGRVQWPFWCTHLAILLLIVAAPIFDFAWQVAQSPSMPDDVKAALRAEARSIASNAYPDEYVSIYGIMEADVAAIDETNDADNPSQRQNRNSALQRLKKWLAYADERPQRGLRTEWADLSTLSGNLYLARARLEQSPGDLQALEAYRTWVEAVAVFAEGLRQSTYLVSQERADDAEQTLITELQLTKTKQRIGTEAWTRYMQQVSDREARNQSRRRAVLVSWYNYISREDDDQYLESLGGFRPSVAYVHGSAMKNRWTYPRRIDHLVWTLIRYLEFGPTASDAEKTRFLRQQPGPLPANHWFGAWEQAGTELAKESNEPNIHSSSSLHGGPT